MNNQYPSWTDGSGTLWPLPSLPMPMESFLSEEAKGRLTEKFGIIANSFDHNVLTTLALACDEGYVTSTRLRYSLNLHKSEISDMLN